MTHSTHTEIIEILVARNEREFRVLRKFFNLFFFALSLIFFVTRDVPNFDIIET